MSDTPLPPCPCGETPLALVITGEGKFPEYAYVRGSCCYEWLITFFNAYYSLGSTESLSLATEAWTDAPRAKQEPKA
jgi:hypothetical protein